MSDMISTCSLGDRVVIWSIKRHNIHGGNVIQGPTVVYNKGPIKVL